MAYKKFHRQKKQIICTLLALGVSALGAAAQAQNNLYRYINDRGTKVIASSIPPKYVRFGYEILTSNGRVKKVVPPELAPEDKERAAQKRALIEKYKMLTTRYSSTRDLILGRDRRLSSVDTNIAVIARKIEGITGQIESQMNEAATLERAGKKIPARIFKTIENLREKLAATEETLSLRRAEHENITAKFEADILLFEQGRALITSGFDSFDTSRR